MKRSGREGRWADISSARIRLAGEAAFLIVVAGGAVLAQLSPPAIIGLMLLAWLVVALVERASSRQQARALAGEEETQIPSMPAAEPLPAPAAALELELEAVVAEVVFTEPAVTKRGLEIPGLEEPDSAWEAAAPPNEAQPPEAPRVSPPVERVPQPPPEPPRVPPREWNVWDLERSARAQAGNADRDEEWAALFLHLRPYAKADGVLPLQFDDLVRESFSELIRAA